MKRKLLRQLATEWRSNTWLAIELLIISSTVWYIIDFCGTYIRIAMEPIGVDIENCFEVGIRFKSEGSPGYIAHSNEPGDRNSDDLATLTERLRTIGDIEAVTSGSTRPYNYNFWGSQMDIAEQGVDTVASVDCMTNNILADPDYFRVFRTTGYKGETPEQLAEILRSGKAVLTDNIPEVSSLKIDPANLYNSRVIIGETEFEIGAVIPPVRRTDFEPVFHATLFRPNLENVQGLTTYVRVKPGHEKDFAKRLVEMSTSLNYGNAYIADVVAMEQIRDDLHRDDWAKIRNLLICMGFLLLMVFLGLLGTFWFRTQQRVHEIAIRKVNGASKGQIFRRLIGEGLLLLLLITPLAFGIDCLLVHNGLSLSEQMGTSDKWLIICSEAVLTAVLLGLMIVAGIYFPARKATSIEPADVLRGE